MTPRESQWGKKLCLQWKGAVLPPGYWSHVTQGSTSFPDHLWLCLLPQAAAWWHSGNQIFTLRCKNVVVWFGLFGTFVWLGFFWLCFFPHFCSLQWEKWFFFSFSPFPFLLRKKKKMRWKKYQSHYVFLHYHYYPCKTMPPADPSVLEDFGRNIKVRFSYFEFLRKINWLLSQFIFLPLLCCTWSKTYSQT